VILLATGQYVPSRSIKAGAKQRNHGARRTGKRKAGTLLLRTGTEWKNNSGQSLIIPGKNPPSTGDTRAVEVMHASDHEPAP
jgi:hypothetical protein